MPSAGARRARKRSSARSESEFSAKTRIDSGRALPVRSDTELSALQSFRTIFGSARTHDSEVRRISGISGSQLWALAEIAASEGLSVNALAERTALHQTTASNLVNTLVEAKLIRRVRDGTDKRVIHLHTSAEGKRVLLQVRGPHAGLLVDALQHLELDQLERLRESLALLVHVMRRTAGTAAGHPLMGE